MNDAEANQAYGALAEGFYVASHTFERAMAQTLQLLKTGQWKAVGDGFDDINKFVRSLKLNQFGAVLEQRREFVEQVTELELNVSNRAAADALGVSHSTVNRWQADGPNRPLSGTEAAQYLEKKRKDGTFVPRGAADGRRDARRIIQRDTRAERREEKLASIAEAAELKGQYSVIYADPPWADEFGPNDRQAELHYPVMTLDEIKALPVRKISTDDAVLYLWALPHMVPSALEVVTAWGFEYRTHLMWTKDKIGLGEWVRQQHEVLLIGRRGAFPPPPTAVRSPSVIEAPRLEHSAKPDIFAEMIERWYPESAKIELFRRGPARPGWAAWGNQAEAA